MPIITLTTDYGLKDHYIGTLKGAIYQELENVQIVDVTHKISPFNIIEAAYILKNSYASFPKGTVHIIDVDSELSVDNKHTAFHLDDHYFVCPDNGIISLITNDIKPKKIVEINLHKRLEANTTAQQIFVKTACHISRGGSLDIVGNSLREFKHLQQIQPHVNDARNKIVGSVIYIDNYGNVISNISKKLFQEVGKGRPFELQIRKFTFNRVYKNYNDIVNYTLPKAKRQDDGRRLLLFNSANYLEIALYRSNLTTVGGASTLLGLDYQEPVTINFL
ncbi:SAM-dependent chlorinase/fluorinase [Flavobacteriaceae bacterium F08102]|nr:SAM-dependent chlorinase/fluorinase [Flavobacteriaceae bacterium F08102]